MQAAADTTPKCFEYLLVLLKKYRGQAVGNTHELIINYTSSVLGFEGRKGFNINVGAVRLNGVEVPEDFNINPEYSAILRTNNRPLTVVERGKLTLYFEILEKESNQIF